VQPQQEKKKSEVNPTSFPPRLIDPQNRTAMLPIRQAARVELIAVPLQRAATRENAGWQASKD
jgi:hypothetical protein